MADSMKLKYCSSCKTEKPLADFLRNDYSGDYRGQCKTCRAAYARRQAVTEYADITGRRSGLLTAKKFNHFGSTGQQFWLCECACGNTRIVTNMHLLTGHVRSCDICEKRLGRQPGRYILTRERERLSGKSILARKRRQAREWREAQRAKQEKKFKEREYRLFAKFRADASSQAREERQHQEHPVIIVPPILTEAEIQRALKREKERDAAKQQELEKLHAAIRDDKPLPVPQVKIK